MARAPRSTPAAPLAPVTDADSPPFGRPVRQSARQRQAIAALAGTPLWDLIQAFAHIPATKIKSWPLGPSLPRGLRRRKNANSTDGETADSMSSQ